MKQIWQPCIGYCWDTPITGWSGGEPPCVSDALLALDEVLSASFFRPKIQRPLADSFKGDPNLCGQSIGAIEFYKFVKAEF